VSFEVAKAKDYPGNDYDLVAFFDALHDMGDPVGAANHVLSALKSDGTWFGYLRRDPDALYTQWIETLDRTGDYRTMIGGFINSNEYVQRFGP
jgi:hypothetical protein